MSARQEVLKDIKFYTFFFLISLKTDVVTVAHFYFIFLYKLEANPNLYRRLARSTLSPKQTTLLKVNVIRIKT